MSIPSLPDTAPENEQPQPGGKPSLAAVLLLVLASLSVMASGWGVARLTIAGVEAPASESVPAAVPSHAGHPRNTVDPKDAHAFVESSATLLESARSYEISFSLHGRTGAPLPGPDEAEGQAPGEGLVRYDAAGQPVFEHFFTAPDGLDIYRYEMAGGNLLMTAGSGLRVLDPATEADRYLCSSDFGSAKLREVLASSEDLSLAGREELGSGAVLHRYEGTFTARFGSYDSRTGENVVAHLEDAEFELWIGEDGRPHRFSYDTPEGIGETYEYTLAD
ncbi:hypothetical protein [Nocardiopsis algeriensis]|uniref:Uncharacterized protein n=1 Tax=Nocardiopsis algeriensis TaxID=1478215 RepID=A0A841IPK6_9ACTN|nr:hypothetical protein [Nocardiopsis algeriensis]MBB6120657.1 hypothetical protein [Nocardiopsis algeriensis]